MGAALLRNLHNRDHSNLITYSHAKLDLTKQSFVDSFLTTEKREQVCLAFAELGGIYTNST